MARQNLLGGQKFFLKICVLFFRPPHLLPGNVYLRVNEDAVFWKGLWISILCYFILH